MTSVFAWLEASLPLYIGSLVFGLVIGSFLNTVIYRMPKIIYEQHPPHPSFSLWYPASHCPHCNAPLAITHLIPVLSYAILRGRCSFCDKTISVLYPAVEVVSAILTLLVVWHFGLSNTMVAALIFSYAMIALSIIDYREKILPDQITLGLLWLGLFINIDETFAPLASAVIGAIAGYSAFWMLNQLCVWIIKKSGLGYGDMKLLAALGAWFGWNALPTIAAIAALSALFVSLALLVSKKMNRHEPIAFGHYLCISGWLFLFFSSELLALPALIGFG